jgi:hypothetical protein
LMRLGLACQGPTGTGIYIYLSTVFYFSIAPSSPLYFNPEVSGLEHHVDFGSRIGWTPSIFKLKIQPHDPLFT